MRSFEERMAEIDRRSQNILKERRKKRRRILTVCIPLALCICLCLPFLQNILPGDKSANTMSGVTGESKQEADMGDGQTGQSVVKIDVTGDGISKTVTDSEEITHITAQLNAIAGGSAMGNGSDPGADVESFLTGSTSDQVISGYAVTLHMENGTAVQYLLSGSKLTDLAAEQISYLTQQQVQELKDLLGIPQ